MAAPLVPRLHLFEIDDQPWFPAFLRALVQNSLTAAWGSVNPVSGHSSASLAASVLIRHLGHDLSSYTFVDFCAGSGGPSPIIERCVNAHLSKRARPSVDFLLTDLHPNTTAWEKLARESRHVKFESSSVDASKAPRHITHQYNGKDVFRIFNLAFHHFDDPLARKILKDTVEKSQGFAIFEMQDRSLLSIVTVLLFGLGIFLTMPYYAYKWRSPSALFFTYVIPILPFVLVYDGLISSLRTRTAYEVEALMRGCGADTSLWEVRHGTDAFLWPFAHMNWVVCRPVRRQGYEQ